MNSSLRLALFFRVRLVKLTRSPIRVFFYFESALNYAPYNSGGEKKILRSLYTMEIIVCYRVAL